ncbi:MAG: glycosyltransferase [Clostridiales bacterium]|nr:glycosyltransferase [Clostridiales bacterium]
MTEHAFAICAYKESAYLEACISSLENQTVPSPIIICTSTPCEYIQNIADRHGLQVYVRDGSSDIQDDWNFACDHAEAKWVTVAHQDDVYAEQYVEKMLEKIHKSKNAVMAFSDYRPILHNKISMDRNCRLRRLLRLPMKWSLFAKSRFFKKRCLSMGNCISCPSVIYNKEIIHDKVFTSELRYSLDWDTFLKYAGYKERFVYVDKPLVFYRIHSEATSMEFINNNHRIEEDIIMFRKFWPSFIVKIIMHFYVRAYQTYRD